MDTKNRVSFPWVKAEKANGDAAVLATANLLLMVPAEPGRVEQDLSVVVWRW